jgi:hypothetical protein
VARTKGNKIVHYGGTFVFFTFGFTLSLISLAGFLDDRISYCDTRTNPCSTEQIPSWDSAQLPANPKMKKTIPGNQGKILLALAAIPCFALSWYLSGILKRHLMAEAESANLTKQIEDREKIKIAEFSSGQRFNQFQQQVFQTIADIQAIDNSVVLKDSQPSINPAQGREIQESFYSPAQPVDQSYIPHIPNTPLNTGSGSPIPPGNPPSNPPSGINPRYNKYYTTGRTAIESMVHSHRSIVLASSSGTGKTTTELEWMRLMKIAYPVCDFYAITQKADNLGGLREQGRVWVYDAFNPIPSFEPLDIVYEIFDKRRNTGESERGSFKNQPVRLILCDWFATFVSISQHRDKDLWNTVKSKISSIITVGREFNVCIFCDTQSINMKSLGLADDASIRKSIDIYSQGFKKVTEDNKSGVGDYDTMRLVINNPYVCEPRFADHLKQEMGLLADAIAKGEVNSPIILLANAYPPMLGLIPPKANPIELPPQTSVPLAEVAEVKEVIAKPNSVDDVISDDVISRLNQAYGQERHYTRNQFTRDNLKKAINQLRPLMSEEQVIATLWMVVDKASVDWTKAVSEYQEVTRTV